MTNSGSGPHPTPREAGKHSPATDAQEAKEMGFDEYAVFATKGTRKFYRV